MTRCSEPDGGPDARSALARPLTLPCGQELPNRFLKTAMSETLAEPDSGPGRRLERLYARWADGGWGVVLTGNVMVDHVHIGEGGNVAVQDDRHLDRLARWADCFADRATPLWMQVNHPGRQANPIASSHRPVAPSAVAAELPGAARPEALDAAGIRDIVDRFGHTAALAESAGFRGMQVHAAHGYLVAQFLSPRSNRRTDAWGGDAQGRRRFLLDVVRAVRQRVSPGFAVSVKLNSTDFQQGGFDEHECRDVVAALAGEAVDLIEISGGTFESPAMIGGTRRSTAEREAYFLDYARTVRAGAGDIPLAVTGGFRTRDAMERAIEDGHCDLVGIGRPASVDPEGPHRLLQGTADRLRTGSARMGARPVVNALAGAPALWDSMINMQWHTDQLRRMGHGKAPDVERPWWRTLAAALLRNGPGALRRRRE